MKNTRIPYRLSVFLSLEIMYVTLPIVLPLPPPSHAPLSLPHNRPTFFPIPQPIPRPRFVFLILIIPCFPFPASPQRMNVDWRTRRSEKGVDEEGDENEDE